MAESPRTAAGPALHATMAAARSKTSDEAFKELNRLPLFMTELDETDGEGGENWQLEALRQLAWEGTRAEVTGNFKEHGNECAQQKNWADAKEYYTKALAALKQDRPELAEMELVQVDLEEEARKERALEEACYVNRALCHLELKNYRSCNFDCAATLRINFRNIKAWYRSASACLALDKTTEAEDVCSRGLEVDGTNTALLSLQKRIQARTAQITKTETARREREENAAKERAALRQAIKTRNIPTRKTDKPPNTEDAVLKLSSPLDPTSTLSVPVLVLYPAHSQTDLIKGFEETQSLRDHLSYLLPLPWDEGNEYSSESADCYMPTPSSGLIKAGKKLPLGKLLESGKVELVDDMLQVYVVPQSKAAAWIDDYKLTKGLR